MSVTPTPTPMVRDPIGRAGQCQQTVPRWTGPHVIECNARGAWEAIHWEDFVTPAHVWPHRPGSHTEDHGNGLIGAQWLHVAMFFHGLIHKLCYGDWQVLSSTSEYSR